MLQTAEALSDGANYRALIMLVPPHPNREGELMPDDLREGGIPVFETMIRHTVGFAKAAMIGRAIRDIDDTRTKVAWEDYKSLGNEIRGIIK